LKILLFILFFYTFISAKIDIKNYPDNGDYTSSIDDIVTIKTVLRSNDNEDLRKQIMFPKSADYKILKQSSGGTSSSTSVSFVNGQMTKVVEKSIIYYTQLKFNKKGIYTIKSPKFIYKGKTISGNNLKISIGKKIVEDESLTPKFWFYIKSSKVYTNIGDQIILTIEFGARSDVQISQLNVPDIQQIEKELSKKFILKKLFKNSKDIEKSLSQDTRNKTIYNLYKLKYVLYPFKKGSINIGPFDISYAAIERNHRGQNSDPFNIFYSRRERKSVKESNLWSIYIKDQKFSAGKYKLRYKFSADSVKVGEPISIDVNISGKGNIKSLNLPNYSKSKDFVTYSPEITYKDAETLKTVTNKAKIKYLLIPKFMGKFTIPKRSIKYYNSIKKRVDSLIIPSKLIKVGENPNSTTSSFSNISNNSQKSNYKAKRVTTEKEISYIYKNINLKKSKIIKFITDKRTLVVLFFLNILLLIWSVVVILLSTFFSRSKKSKLISKISKKSDINMIKNLLNDYLIERSKNRLKGKSLDEISFLASSIEFKNLKNIVSFIEKLENGKYSQMGSSSNCLNDYILPIDLKKLIKILDKDEKWTNL